MHPQYRKTGAQLAGPRPNTCPAKGPPTGMQVLQLQEERKLSAQEIRRLSPCATFYRSLIGVRWDPEEGFWIWGILNSGTRWVARIDGGRLQSSAAPDRLIINVSGPGNLIISRGDSLIGTLLNGRLEGHGLDIYEARCGERQGRVRNGASAGRSKFGPAQPGFHPGEIPDRGPDLPPTRHPGQPGSGRLDRADNGGER